jgi:hypothetical protein
MYGKRQVLSFLCTALLLWAAFDDVVAAQTPNLDDDIAAALDNDCLCDASVNVLARAETERIMRTCPPQAGTIAIRPTPRMTGSVRPSEACRFSDSLFCFMSLQC